jgi:ABC-2 type transport system ATP-binding protein
LLKIEKLTKTYKGGKRAVDCLDLTVNAGDIFGFIGHNGAGKTTTLKCIAGILDFDGGEIYVDGKSVKTSPVEAKKVLAYIPDNPDLYDYLTGVQYLNFIADVYGIEKSLREERIQKYADGFELTPWLGDLISAYSHGMKQKLAIISAFLHNPKLLILDEPFVGLDPKASIRLKEMMRERCKEGGAIFFSTHVLDVAEKLCNKIAIIKGGKLVISGDTEKLTGENSLEDLFMEVVDD